MLRWPSESQDAAEEVKRRCWKHFWHRITIKSPLTKNQTIDIVLLEKKLGAHFVEQKQKEIQPLTDTQTTFARQP
jgi:hypothetical protein